MTLDLRDENSQVLSGANLELIIEPQPTGELPPALQPAHRNIRELITSIKEAPLPQGWEDKTTADGRTYFERASDRKITIAYDFSARLEEHLGVSTTEESRRKGNLLKEAEGKGVEIETNLAGLPRGRER
jgi:hypothetical protein